MSLSTEQACFPQIFALLFGWAIAILVKLQPAVNRIDDGNLQNRAAYATLGKIEMSSGASRWPCGLPHVGRGKLVRRVG